jgi:hypothetical protein
VLFSEAIPRLSNGTLTLDDLVLKMVHNRLANRDHSITTWLSLLATAVGQDAYGSYDAIHNGTIFIPAPDSLGEDYILRPTEEHQFYLGVDPGSFLPSGPGQTVKGLDLESRAAVEGGLLATDVLTSRSSSMVLATQYGGNVSLIVLREEKEVEVAWAPRSWDFVRSFRWQRVEV